MKCNKCKNKKRYCEECGQEIDEYGNHKHLDFPNTWVNPFVTYDSLKPSDYSFIKIGIADEK